MDGEKRVSRSVIQISWRYLLTQPKIRLNTTDLSLSSHRTHGPAEQRARINICHWCDLYQYFQQIA
jgi:hypothetical protein